MHGPPHNDLFSGIHNQIFVLVFQSDGKFNAQRKLAERFDNFLVSQQMANVVQ